MSDGGPRRAPSRARKPSAAGTALRGIGLALLGSLLVGFAFGLWLRCALEKSAPPLLGAAGGSGTATRPRVGG